MTWPKTRSNRQKITAVELMGVGIRFLLPRLSLLYPIKVQICAKGGIDASQPAYAL